MVHVYKKHSCNFYCKFEIVPNNKCTSFKLSFDFRQCKHVNIVLVSYIFGLSVTASSLIQIYYLFFLKDFFAVDYFQSFYWMCYSIASVLCLGFFGQEAYRTSAPQPGIKPVPSALGDEVLTTGPPGKSLL